MRFISSISALVTLGRSTTAAEYIDPSTFVNSEVGQFGGYQQGPNLGGIQYPPMQQWDGRESSATIDPLLIEYVSSGMKNGLSGVYESLLASLPTGYTPEQLKDAYRFVVESMMSRSNHDQNHAHHDPNHHNHSHNHHNDHPHGDDHWKRNIDPILFEYVLKGVKNGLQQSTTDNVQGLYDSLLASMPAGYSPEQLRHVYYEILGAIMENRIPMLPTDRDDKHLRGPEPTTIDTTGMFPIDGQNYKDLSTLYHDGQQLWGKRADGSVTPNGTFDNAATHETASGSTLSSDSTVPVIDSAPVDKVSSELPNSDVTTPLGSDKEIVDPTPVDKVSSELPKPDSTIDSTLPVIETTPVDKVSSDLPKSDTITVPTTNTDNVKAVDSAATATATLSGSTAATRSTAAQSSSRSSRRSRRSRRN